jgi:predicted TIM-barrel fold metal-dependent hydrolase
MGTSDALPQEWLRGSSLCGRKPPSHDRHECSVILRVNHAKVGLRGGVVVLVRKNRNDVRVGTGFVEELRQRTSSGVVQLVTEQQDSAAAHADLEQRGHDRLQGHDPVANEASASCRDFARAGIG